MKYVYFIIFFLVVRALWEGYDAYRENREAGYNVEHFRQTGEKVKFYGGFWEMVGGTIAAALGLLTSPPFIVIEMAKSIPALVVLYLLTQAGF